ncbi:MAG: SPOR domain-containing protein, partial [Desulfobacterales bacterium]|nr:SPOR domain-containing protein [Desulfobacterales bacterium]
MAFFRSEMLHVKFLMLLILTALFIFLPCSGSSGGEAEDEYHGVYVVSSCKNFDDATALVNTLRAQGYDSFCKTVDIPKKGKWHRVFVKRYKNRIKALFAGKRLRETGVIKSFILLKTEPEDNPASAKMEVEGKISPVPASAKKKLDLPNTKEVALLPDKEIMPADKKVLPP